MQVERRQRFAARDQLVYALQIRKQALQRWLHFEHHARTERCNEFCVAAELDRVAQALFGMHEERPAGHIFLAEP